MLQIEYLKKPEADTCYSVYILILTTLKLTLVTMYIFFYQTLRPLLQIEYFKTPGADACYKVYINYPEADACYKLNI